MRTRTKTEIIDFTMTGVWTKIIRRDETRTRTHFGE